jgi:HEPN domain-containing protein
MNRGTFRKLAETRLEDAKTLLNAGRFEAAYYLAGYAVECALKACICTSTREFDFPQKNGAEYYVHSLTRLATLAEIDLDFSEARRDDEMLDTYWTLVKDWREDRRYRTDVPNAETEARNLIKAISDEEH